MGEKSWHRTRPVRAARPAAAGAVPGKLAKTLIDARCSSLTALSLHDDDSAISSELGWKRSADARVVRFSKTARAHTHVERLKNCIT